MKAWTTLKTLWKDESGQGATEYILLLVVVVGLGMLFREKIREIVENKMADLKGLIGDFGTQ